jgi:hypothetical protein
MRWVARLLAAVAFAGVVANEGHAAERPSQLLADRYAPVVELKKQSVLCGKGEGYRPVAVDLVLGRKDVSLFLGAASKKYTRVGRGPEPRDLYGRGRDYYVDLPGHPVSEPCSYEKWFNAIGAGAPNVVYAHVATERGDPGRLALQYWLYYVFNDFNDKHESDWEMIQLNFEAATPAEALQRHPTEVLYSQHQGAERAWWGDDKLRLVGGTHIVTYPGAGSHANYFRDALWLGRSAGQGIGCDDSTGPSTRVRPTTLILPTDVAGAGSSLAWVAFEGHWGQREKSFNDGPFGPNTKRQWREPFTWAEAAGRDSSFAVPGTAHQGLDGTDFYCGAIPAATRFMDAVYAAEWLVFSVLGLLAVLCAVLVARTTWRPTTLRPLEQRRAAGQILGVSLRVYRLGWRTFLLIGLLVLPLTCAAALCVHLLQRVDPIGNLMRALGHEDLLHVHANILVLAAIQIAGVGFAIAATAVATASLRLGEEPLAATGPFSIAAHRVGALAGVLLRVAGIPFLLAITIIGIPVAFWYLGRTAVALPACVIERLDAGAAIRRSKDLVGSHPWRAATLTTLTIAAAILIGPLVGAAILLSTPIPFTVTNLIAMAVSAAVMPLAGITISLLFLDFRSREHEVAESELVPGGVTAEHGLA